MTLEEVVAKSQDIDFWFSRYDQDSALNMMPNVRSMFKILGDKFRSGEISEDYKQEVIKRSYARISISRAFFNALPKGSTRAKMLNVMVDELTAANKRSQLKNAKDIYCRKGCSNCCYQRVTVTEDEAELLVGEIKTAEQAITLRQQAEIADTTDAWAKCWPNSACVFLSKDGECTVYDKRPMVCRTVFAITKDPAVCDVRSDKETLVFAPFDAELLISAVFTEARTGNLARMIYEKFNNRAIGKPYANKMY